MSFEHGWAAIHLDMPPRVPRTEYSAEGHLELVRRVTGREVDQDSPKEKKIDGTKAFIGPNGWDYSFRWSILLNRQVFGELRTSMGHAEYAAGGTDLNRHIHCPFESVEEVLAFDPVEAYGRPDHAEWVKRFEEHYEQNVAFASDSVNMTGVYITLISGLLDIFGWDLLLLALGTDPQAFGRVANRYADWIQPYFNALADADVPVVMVHDDIVWTSGPFCSPDWYREYIFPNYHKLFAPLVESGKKIAYTSDGDYSLFIDDVAAAGVSGFVMEPMTDMAYIAERYGKTHFFIGNVDTRTLLANDRAAIRAEVERCMRVGKDCPGFFLAVGNHIPSNTPVEAALFYNELYEEMAAR
jgi:hypothetical protein